MAKGELKMQIPSDQSWRTPPENVHKTWLRCGWWGVKVENGKWNWGYIYVQELIKSAWQSSWAGSRSQARHYLMMLELTWATQVEISHFDWGFFGGKY